MNFYRRGCYLDEEKKLKFFKKFTKNNCRSECLANKTLELCGCAQFFMVREKVTRICGVSDMKCFKKLEEESNSVDWCDCLLECGEIVYKTELKRTEYMRFNQGLYLVDFSDFSHTSRILVFFKYPDFFPNILKQQLTTLDFISYCGGALGLFLGFSAVSAIEIVYYFSVRIWFDRKQHTKVSSFNESNATSDDSSSNNFLVQVMNSTSIHGFNHVARPKRTFSEKWTTNSWRNHILKEFFVIFQIFLVCHCSHHIVFLWSSNKQHLSKIPKRTYLDDLWGQHFWYDQKRNWCCH